MHLSFNDSTKTIVIDTPAGNSITIDEQSMKIEIKDQNQNKITMESTGIEMESPANIDIKAGAVLTLGAGTSLAIIAPSLSVKADADVSIQNVINTRGFHYKMITGACMLQYCFKPFGVVTHVDVKEITEIVLITNVQSIVGNINTTT